MSDSTSRAASDFTETATERFYDAEDAHYRSFWDKAGSLHWGVFDEQTGDDFLKACANLNTILAARSGLDARSEAIDLGCGNGNTTLWLARTTGCRIHGIDLSGVRVDNAKEALRQEGGLDGRVRFAKASMTALPYDEATFTHAVSQAAFYHVPDKEAALREAYRVLRPGGVLVFDDLIKPTATVSDRARQYVYDRLMFDTDYSFEGYQDQLRDIGFSIGEAVDLSDHLATSYRRLADLAERTREPDPEHFRTLALAYRQMVACIEDREVGWALYVCRKHPGSRP